GESDSGRHAPDLSDLPAPGRRHSSEPFRLQPPGDLELLWRRIVHVAGPPLHACLWGLAGAVGLWRAQVASLELFPRAWSGGQRDLANPRRGIRRVGGRLRRFRRQCRATLVRSARKADPADREALRLADDWPCPRVVADHPRSLLAGDRDTG